MLDIPDNVLQFGFAASVGVYLVYFMTNTHRKSMEANTAAISRLALILMEVYRTSLVLHSAETYTDPSSPDHCKRLLAIYTDVLERIKTLQSEMAGLIKDGK